MRPIIAVDVDLTVVDTLTSWVSWYRKLTGHDILDDLSSYQYRIEDIMEKHKDPLEYWRKPDLYDELIPIKGSQYYLKQLSVDFDIIFVSHCFPEHITSKEYFLQRNFPFHKGFISTQHKEYIKCDYFIDDYSKYFDKVKEIQGAECLLFGTDLKQDQETYNWEEIYYKIKGN